MDSRGPMFNTQIVRVDWFKSASVEAERTFRLINQDILPKVLRGNFAVTTCLHILRCVFGSANDAEAIEALKRYVAESEAYWKREVELDDSKN